MVDALNGEPGVFSARYSGENANDSNNNITLLKNMAHLNKEARAARFECVIALIDKEHNNQIHTFRGTWEGVILNTPKGSNGFGYDPLFEIPEYHRTFGELGSAVKSVLSHRARAIRRIVPEIKVLISAGEL